MVAASGNLPIAWLMQ